MPSAFSPLPRAWADPSFRLLALGFSVCGFHVAFLATQLPGVVASCGLPPEVGAWGAGHAGLVEHRRQPGHRRADGVARRRFQLKHLLSTIYLVRAVAVLIFVLAPKTTAVVLVFSAVMGLSFLSVVPPTATLVARFFGPAHMATLFGLVMVSHRVGGFLGAWMGGKVYEATGGFNWMWGADIALALAAAMVHLPIRERQPALQPA